MLKQFLTISVTASLLCACGDEVTKVYENDTDGKSKIDTVHSVDTLVINNYDTLVVNNIDTVIIDNRDTISSIDTFLVHVKDTIVLKHTDSILTKDTLVIRDTVMGLNGKDGTSCTAIAIDNGYKIMCGDDSIGVVLNGEKGEPGAALCDTALYDPATHYCNNGKVQTLNKCNGTLYNPTTHYCQNTEKVAKYEEITDSRNGHVYQTVIIGAQTWIKNAVVYPDENMSQNWDMTNAETLSSDASKLRYFTWEEAKTACPDGWHLPDTTEFSELFNYILKNGKTAGSFSLSMPYVGYYNSSASDGENPLPDDYHFRTFIWTSSEYDADNAMIVTFYFDYLELNSISVYKMNKQNGLSVLCTKD